MPWPAPAPRRSPALPQAMQDDVPLPAPHSPLRAYLHCTMRQLPCILWLHSRRDAALACRLGPMSQGPRNVYVTAYTQPRLAVDDIARAAVHRRDVGAWLPGAPRATAPAPPHGPPQPARWRPAPASASAARLPASRRPQLHAAGHLTAARTKDARGQATRLHEVCTSQQAVWHFIIPLSALVLALSHTVSVLAMTKACNAESWLGSDDTALS